MQVNIRADISGLAGKVLAAERLFMGSGFQEALATWGKLWIAENFQRRGTETRWKPLSPNTVCAKGSDQPLIASGAMFHSQFVRIAGRSIVMGFSDPKAPWHHFGTPAHVITPKSGRVLRFMTCDGPVFARHVNHPGIPARPMLPTPALAQREMAKTAKLYIAGQLRSIFTGRAA